MALSDRRTIDLKPEQWARLEQMALETHSRARHGPETRQPSWRKMIARIANGEIVIFEKDPDERLAAIDRAIAKNAERAKRLDVRRQPALFETAS